MNKAENKVQRLLQIEALLLDHPEGLSQSEIARRLDVNRSTIHRYLPDLTQHAPIFEEDGRIFIDRKSYLVNLKLNLFEALSLHLATRLLTNRIERHNPHSASLLRKLSQTIEKLSPQISKHLTLSADVADDPSRFQDPHYLSVLETLALAWAEGREVKIWHRHTQTQQVHQYRFKVYFIEPYAVGYAIHVIGLRHPPGELRTFNLSRIERVELTDQYYKIPEDFDPTILLNQAWGIWYTEDKPEEVQLRFSPKVSQRVLETRWHPSQLTQTEPDGSLLWMASIAEPLEMLPWIRGWGSDCEVIAPQSLRQKIINEISVMREKYVPANIEQHMQMWAKFSKGNEDDWHPLVWHLLDTAAVVLRLWQDCLCNSYKRELSESFHLSIDEMGALLSFWVALHDLGKASPEFQKKNKNRDKLLRDLGFSFPVSRFAVEGFHGTGTTLILKRIFLNESDMPRKFRINLAITLGGHHGEFPSNADLNKHSMQAHHVGDEKWQNTQNTIYSSLKTFLKVPEITYYPEENAILNPIFILLAGLTTAADWIASNENYFPYASADIPMNQYFEIAKREAKNALETLGWYGWKSTGTPSTFEEIFPGFTPNLVQQAVIDLVPKLHSPFLSIIEAPTGSGKTEAALYIADTVTQRDEKAGIYIAMPTQATSNQMFTRTAEFLARRYPQNKINLHLVHGAALMGDQQDNYQPNGVWGDDQQTNPNIQSRSWFLPRKRTLLAHFGVGTVDQTFISVLKSRHFFLRLFGLSHKVLIFDEVHAYDVYMTEIFKTLLHWLRGVGTSVIILSATLPNETRQELLQAYGVEELPIEKVEFPRISIASEKQARIVHAGELQSRQVQLKWVDQNVESLIGNLKTYLDQGGCAAVICNRIKRAQDVYDAVCQAFKGESVDILLFHSRYPYLWRKDIEDQIIQKFGKNKALRPHKAIVIATQVIEQSLDLDFDFMITDLAPIDLLIQRIGRLHRHGGASGSQRRSHLLKKPICLISAPDLDVSASLPDFGLDKYVYEPYLLLRTLLWLRGRDSIWLPFETDLLIEQVYSIDKSNGLPAEIWEKMQPSLNDMLKHHTQSEANAGNFIIPSTEIAFLGNLQSPLSDNISGISRKILTAPTREIEPSIQIVCLIEEDDGVHILGDSNVIDLEEPLSHQQVITCLKASLSLNQKRVVNFFLSHIEIPESFKDCAALRWHFPAIFHKGKFLTETLTLSLDQKRGVQVKSN